MNAKMLKALVRANKIAFQNWLDSTALEDAVRDDLYLSDREGFHAALHPCCDCEKCKFNRMDTSDGRSIQ